MAVRWNRRDAVVILTGLIGVALAVLVAVAIVNRAQAGRGGGPLEPLPGPDPGMGSVYALAIEPGNESLYAGARFGLFQITAEGVATRVANRHQEIHAVAVLGPGHLLASGHPDPREDLPAKLGLVESTDGGLTWDALSLAGEADFHTLVARHGRVYGYDSGAQRFMVSTDRRQWDFRTILPVTDFAVSPSDPALVIAVSEQSLVRSTDGGHTFTVEESAAQVAALAWPATEALFGVTVDGQVQLSGDGGRTWERRGRVDGVPQAIVAADDARLYVATDTGIYASDDGGQTFTLHYREQ